MIELGVVKSIQQMNAARSGGSQTHPQPAGELGVSTCHERGCFLVAYLNKANLVLSGAQRFHDSIDSISRKAEDDIHAPADQAVDESLCSIQSRTSEECR